MFSVLKILQEDEVAHSDIGGTHITKSKYNWKTVVNVEEGIKASDKEW